MSSFIAKNLRFAKKVSLIRNPRLSFSATPTPTPAAPIATPITPTAKPYVPPKSRISKLQKGITLAALVAFVGGIYMTAITKMKQTDDLESLIDKETMIAGKKK